LKASKAVDVGLAEDDLAPDGHAAFDAAIFVRHALHPADVGPDPLAGDAVAAGDRGLEAAVVVEDLDGDAVELLGDGEIAPRVGGARGPPRARRSASARRCSSSSELTLLRLPIGSS
jgi:hypothetical protein